MAATREQIVELLKQSYSMEVETVINYLAHSINLDGVRAEEIKKSLSADVAAETVHAQQVGARIKQLGGLVSGSLGLKFNQPQPSPKTTDVMAAIRAVIQMEEAACAQYKRIIRETDGDDYVTQELCIRLLADEEGHLILFKGFLKEYTEE